MLKLIWKNAFRHKLRTSLTLAGIVVAILAFGMLRTVVNAWYAGVDATSASRLVTRHAVSLVFSLPVTYRDKIRQVDGVKAVSWANWFGGVYISEKNFFPQFAVDAASYFPLYPEFVIDEEEMKAFLRDRKGAMVGAKLARTYGWKVGDQVTLKGTIFPGNWEFVIRGIYHGIDQKTDQSTFFFHWQYLNETLRKTIPRRADGVGVFVSTVTDPQRAAEVARNIDSTFRNSLAETLTETEKAFQLSFVSMTEAILVAIQVVSFVVIVIIMAVMANTMAMTARERVAEYATLKALGFGPGYVVRLIFGESLAIALLGGGVGIGLTFPAARAFASQLAQLFPIFYITPGTVALQVAAAVVVGVVAALIPAWRSARLKIVEGLRNIG